MDEQVDHGPIIAQSEFKIDNLRLNSEELSEKLAVIGAELIIQTMPQYLKGEIVPIIQDHSQATFVQKYYQQMKELIGNKIIFK